MDRRTFLSWIKRSTAIGVGISAGLVPNIAMADKKISGLKHALNASDFGLVPNISSDQSQLLQDAIYHATTQQLALFIPAGFYAIADINLPDKAHIFGANGQTKLVQYSDIPIIYANEVSDIVIDNIAFEGNLTGGKTSKILSLNHIKNLNLRECKIYNGNGNGVELYKSSGQIIANEFYKIGSAALHCNDSYDLKIIRNTIKDIDNNGILIWQETKASDNSIISHNHISNIRSLDGGTGQNGNGINVYKGNNVIISDNRIDDCIYSAVRINAGNNCQIINNNCTNIGEVALYAEFAFNGVIINNNLVDLAGAGISMANLNVDGHLAVCKGNLVRNLILRPVKIGEDDARAYGIAAEGDALIEGNIVENATNFGIGGGYGEFQRNISVINNMVKDCGYGITPSVAQNAGKMVISNNSISNSKHGAIIGFEWEEAATSEMVDNNQAFGKGRYKNLHISNNVIA